MGQGGRVCRCGAEECVREDPEEAVEGQGSGEEKEGGWKRGEAVKTRDSLRYLYNISLSTRVYKNIARCDEPRLYTHYAFFPKQVNPPTHPYNH